MATLMCAWREISNLYPLERKTHDTPGQEERADTYKIN